MSKFVVRSFFSKKRGRISFLLLAQIFISVMGSSPRVYANGDSALPYSFGGACSSQGTWTGTALQATLKIREVVLQLKNNDNCKGLQSGILSSLDELNKRTSELDSSKSDLDTVATIPTELRALTSFIQSSPQDQSEVVKLIFNKAMKGAALSAKVEASGGLASADSTPANGASNASMASNMLELGARVQRTTSDGMVLIDQFLDNLPQFQECLTEGNLMGPLLSSSTTLLSSFMSAGVTGSGMARLISKLSSAMRDSNYAAILRKLDEQSFLASTACLIDMTAEAYCSARDARHLFDDEMGSTQFGDNAQEKMDPDSPFLGYYILSQQVPVISKWLQKIQIGIDPQLVTDAQFQNGILQQVTDFQKNVKNLQAEYASRLETIKSQSTTTAQQGQVFELLKAIYSYLDTGGSRSGLNFFAISVGGRIMRLPFDLIGIPTPAQVSGNFEGTVMQMVSWETWLQSHMDSLPIFGNPVVLAQTIGENMSKIIANAQTSANEYYSRWFLVDKQAIVSDSLTSITYSVKDSLIAINSYLARLAKRIQSRGGDRSIIGSIVDTRGRIDRVLKAYSNLEDIARQHNGLEEAFKDPKAIERISDVMDSIVKTVSNEFMVVLAKTSFLANRMVTFVYYDYSLLVRSQKDFSSYEKDLFVAIGRTLVDNMVQLYSGSPANVKSDLSMALTINKRNIEAVESLLKDPLVAMIGRLRLTAESKDPRHSSIANDSEKRLLEDSGMTGGKPISKEKLTAWDRLKIYAKAWITPGAVPAKTMWQYVTHRDRYPMPITSKNDSQSPDDEFGSAANMRAQLCIQALAFNDLRSFRNLCEGQVLQSPFPASAMASASNPKEMQNYLSMSFSDKEYESKDNLPLNHSQRICAFRDWNRRNMVMWMRLNSPKNELGSPQGR